MLVISVMAPSLMRVEIAGGGARAMPSFFSPVLAHITESTALKGREQTLSSLGSIKGNRRPRWGTGSRGLCEPARRGGDGQGLRVP